MINLRAIVIGFVVSIVLGILLSFIPVIGGIISTFIGGIIVGYLIDNRITSSILNGLIMGIMSGLIKSIFLYTAIMSIISISGLDIGNIGLIIIILSLIAHTFTGAIASVLGSILKEKLHYKI